MADFLDAVKQVAVEMGVEEYLETGIDPEATPNLFICDLDDSAIEAQFSGLPRTEIKDGIRKTMKCFQQMAESGKVVV